MKNTLRITIGFIAALALLSGGVVFADSADVSTSVSVSASTGGNSVSGGTTSEGSSSSHVSVTTSVNGEVVQSIEEHSEGGEPIEETHVYENEEGNVRVETSVSAKGGLPDGAPTAQKEKTEIHETQKVEELSEDIETDVESDISVSSEDSMELKQTPIIASISNFVAKLFNYVFSIFG